MNVNEFLKKLAKLYESDKKEDDFKERIQTYSKILNKKEENGKKIDYEKTIDNIVTNYPYRIYPNFTEILKNLVYIPNQEKKTIEKPFVPRKFLITMPNGNIYEFVEVPSSWENVPNLSYFKGCTVKEIF